MHTSLKPAIKAGMDNLIRWGRHMAQGDPVQVVAKGHPDIPHWHVRHNVGRAIDALLRGSDATAKPVPPDVEDVLRQYLFASMDNPTHLNGASIPEQGRIVFHAHDVREALLSLTALIQYRQDDEARQRIADVLDAIERLTNEDGTFCADQVARFPMLAEGYFQEQRRNADGKTFNIACWTRGRWIMALCRYYRATGDDRALELAQRFVRLVRRVSFTDDGQIRSTEGGHTHSLTGTVHGLIDYGLLAGDQETFEHGRRIFDVGLPAVSSSYGWSVESAWGDPKLPERGEVNNTGDMIQAALLMGGAGLPQYFEDAERRIRSHVLPSQTGDDGWGFPGPNDLDGGAGNGSILDITAGTVQALCETSRAPVAGDATGRHVNLPFSNWADETRLVSRLPDQWHVTVTPADAGDLFIRIPSWADRQRVRLTVSDQPQQPTFDESWLVVRDLPAGANVVVDLPLDEREAEEVVNKKPYRILWRGDQVVAMSPQGPTHPIFPSIEAYRRG